jgi:hypothetical protein
MHEKAAQSVSTSGTELPVLYSGVMFFQWPHPDCEYDEVSHKSDQANLWD